MRRINSGHFFSEDEIAVAEILLQIPRIIFESKSCFSVNWRFRRTRSSIDRSLSSAPKCENVFSPTTPLSFSSSESGRKRKRPKVSYEKKKEDRLKMVDGLTHQREFPKSEMENVTALNSERKAGKQRKKEDRSKIVDRWTHQRELLKSEIENVMGSHNALTAVNSDTKKDEHWSKPVEDLTHQKELLKTEIENVKRLRNSSKALNSELKTKKQQCNLQMAMAGDKEESGEQVEIPEPLQLFPCHPDRTSSMVASTSGSNVANPMGPQAISDDLNVSPKQNLGPNLCPPLDLSLNLSLNFYHPTQSETERAAAARKKRLQICKVKKPRGRGGSKVKTLNPPKPMLHSHSLTVYPILSFH